MESRQLKALEIASSEIIREGNVWLVPSQSSSKKYTVNLFLQTCTCLDFESYRNKCKHLLAVEYQLQRESGAALPIPDKRVRPTYKQEWHAYNLAQVNEKARFQELLYELCRNLEEPLQHMGRPRLPIADMIFALCYKVYSMFSSRRFNSDLREAHLKGYVSKKPSYNSVCDYFQMDILTPYLKHLIVESSLPLKTVEFDFAVDSSGFSTGVYQKWSEAKWGNARTVYGEKQPNEVNRMDWLKVHLMCGVKTNIVTSIEVTNAHAGDYPQFAPLVNQTSRNFVMNQVSADKGYSGSKNLQLVLTKGAQPFIDFKSNATANSTDKRQTAVWKRMFHWYQYNQAEFMRHYHKRSNVETTFSMIKSKFGERLKSKTITAQTNEVLCKVLCHNVCCLIQSIYELGVEPTFWSE
jgi:transposase